jgi:hypothetical protein
MTAHEYLEALRDKVWEDAKQNPELHRLVDDLMELAERWDWEDAMGRTEQ